MRMAIYLGAIVLGTGLAAPAQAQDVSLNHLDCRFDQASQAMVCPDVLSGRSATAVVAPASSSSADAAKGSPEWNAQCAAKYKSFDPATGLYRSYSGDMRPCL